MGTTYTVRLPVHVEADRLRDLKTEVTHILLAIEDRMSTYDPNSEISRLASVPANETFTVSGDTAAVLNQALKVVEATEGAFDITVGPLVDAWGFGPSGRPQHVPSEQEITSLMQRIGRDKLSFNRSERTVTKTVDGVSVDLSAIAKGYAVDRVAAALEARGHHDYLVEIGGETRARGRNDRGQPWRVAVEKPDGPALALEIDNHGVASSGNYRNSYVLDGQRFAHTIDPRKGRPVTHRLMGTTVIHEDTAMADAWATALMVLGEQEALRMASKEALAAALFVAGPQGIETRTTTAFDAHVADRISKKEGE